MDRIIPFCANSSRKRSSVGARSGDGLRPQARSPEASFSDGVTRNGHQYRPVDWETVRDLANEVGLLLLVFLLFVPKTVVELFLGIIGLLGDLIEKTCGNSWQCRLTNKTYEQKVEIDQHQEETKAGVSDSSTEEPRSCGQEDGLEEKEKWSDKSRRKRCRRKKGRQENSELKSGTPLCLNLEFQTTKAEISFDTDIYSDFDSTHTAPTPLHSRMSDSSTHRGHRSTSSSSSAKPSTEPGPQTPTQPVLSTEDITQPSLELSSLSFESLSLETPSPSSSTPSVEFDKPRKKMAGKKMPQPGTTGAPHFNGTNISTFLKRYDWVCQDYDCTGDEKRVRIVRYMDYHLGEQVENMEEYQAAGIDYKEAELYDRLRRKWRDEDWDGQKISITYLRALTKNVKEGTLTAEAFLDDYHQVSEALVARKELSSTDQIEILINALPLTIQDRIFQQNPLLDSANVATYDYKTIIKSAREAEKIYDRARRFGEKRNPAIQSAKEEHFSKVIASNKTNATQPAITFPQPPPQVPIQKKVTIEETPPVPQQVPTCSYNQRPVQQPSASQRRNRQTDPDDVGDKNPTRHLSAGPQRQPTAVLSWTWRWLRKRPWWQRWWLLQPGWLSRPRNTTQLQSTGTFWTGQLSLWNPAYRIRL